MRGRKVIKFPQTWKVPAGVTRAWVTFKEDPFRMGNSKATHFVTPDGRLWGCGDNFDGTLGDGTNTAQSTPILIGTDRLWVDVQRGHAESNSAALTKEGNVYTWGGNGAAMGDGSTVPKSTPTLVTKADTLFIACALGSSQGYALSRQRQLFAWGYNFDGNLGVGDTTDRSTPTLVYGGERYRFFGAGTSNGFAIDDFNDLYIWGDNNYAQLGNGMEGFGTEVSVPNMVDTGLGTKWFKASMGVAHVAAIDTEGQIWCWGKNQNGQQGNGDGGFSAPNVSTPTLVAALSGKKFVDVACQGEATFALEDNGVVWAWGFNIAGALGDGTTVSKSSPVMLYGTDMGARFSWIKMGQMEGFAKPVGSSLQPDETGGLMGWGANFGGALGIVNGGAQSQPTHALYPARDIRHTKQITQVFDVVPGSDVPVNPAARLFNYQSVPPGETLYTEVVIEWEEL